MRHDPSEARAAATEGTPGGNVPYNSGVVAAMSLAQGKEDLSLRENDEDGNLPNHSGVVAVMSLAKPKEELSLRENVEDGNVLKIKDSRYTNFKNLLRCKIS